MSSQHSLDKYFKTRRMASTRSAMRFFRTQHNMTLLRPTSSLPRKRPDVGRRQGAPGLRDGSAVRCCDTWCKSTFWGCRSQVAASCAGTGPSEAKPRRIGKQNGMTSLQHTHLVMDIHRHVASSYSSMIGNGVGTCRGGFRLHLMNVCWDS